MTFNDLEYPTVKNEVEAFVKSGCPTPYLCDQVNFTYRIDGNTVKLFLISHAWQRDTGELTDLPVVKMTYVRSLNAWKLYWRRRNLKWECYDTVCSLAEALELVREDRHGCFWG